MRTTFSSFALLVTTLLARDAVAGSYHARLHRRAQATVLVTIEHAIYVDTAGTTQSTAFITKGTSTINAGAPNTVTQTKEEDSLVDKPASPSSTGGSVNNVGGQVAAYVPSAPVSNPVTHSTTTTSSTTTSSGTTVPSAGSGGKKGLAYNDVTALGPLTGSGSWAQNWDHKDCFNLQSKLPGTVYSPMLWNGDDNHLPGFADNVKSCITATTTEKLYILGMNEPDYCPSPPPSIPVSACMGVDDAVKLWKDQIVQFADDAILVTPAITSSDPTVPANANVGTNYLAQFIDKCPQSECKWSRIGVHFYTNCGEKTTADQATALSNFIDTAYKVGGGKYQLVMNELGCLDMENAQPAADFLTAAAKILDGSEKVDRWTFTKADVDFMLSDSGTLLSPLGTTFAGL